MNIITDCEERIFILISDTNPNKKNANTPPKNIQERTNIYISRFNAFPHTYIAFQHILSYSNQRRTTKNVREGNIHVREGKIHLRGVGKKTYKHGTEKNVS